MIASEECPSALRPSDVARSLQISDRKLRMMVAAKEFPAPMRIGRLARWPRDTVDRWLAEKAK